MMAIHNLTEDEINTLLNATGKRHPDDMSVSEQSITGRSVPTPNPTAGNQNPDKLLNTIQDELRHIRSLISSKITTLSQFGANTSPLKLKLLQRLALLGFQPEACEKLFNGIALAPDEDTAWRQITLSLESQLPIAQDNLMLHRGTLAFVGPTGSGKTTGIGKLATKFIQQHHKQDIGLITTDFYSVSGRDQLCIYGRILDIPVHRVNNKTDLTEALENLSDKRLILIDTPGLSQRDPEFQAKLNILLQQPTSIKTILTLPATTHDLLLEEIVQTFNYLPLMGVSISKLDEAPYIGHIISTCMTAQLPILSLSNGQHVPNNFSIATRNAVLNHALQKQDYYAQITTKAEEYA